MTTDTKAVARLVDHSTGEVMGVIPSEEVLDPSEAIPMNAKFSRLVSEFQAQQWPESHIPLHLRALESLPVDDDFRLTLQEAWNSAKMLTMKDFVGEFSGKDVKVYGLMVYEQGPFKAKGTQVPMPGYFQPRLLIESPETGKLLNVRTSSPLVSEIIFYTLKKYGWWVFEEPQTYRFRLDGDGRLQMEHVYGKGEPDIKSRLSRKGATK